jgi:hypothetical protein
MFEKSWSAKKKVDGNNSKVAWMGHLRQGDCYKRVSMRPLIEKVTSVLCYSSLAAARLGSWARPEAETRNAVSRSMKRD